MIHVDARSEPDSFDDLVRQPGQKVLAQGATAVLKPYWRECIVDLRREYRNICAYLSMRIHPATAFATVVGVHRRARQSEVAPFVGHSSMGDLRQEVVKRRPSGWQT